jgi:hypothetical protein
MRRALVGFAIVAIGGLGAAIPLMVSGAEAAPPSAGPYSYIGGDSGTCHPYDNADNEVPWALDLGVRTFTVTSPDPAGNYSIVEKFIKGHWSSSPDPGPNGPGSPPAAGPDRNYSPGDCDNGSDQGHRLTQGIQGTFSGTEHLFIQNGTYTQGDGTCAGEDANGSPNPCTTQNYVTYHYGPNAYASTTVTKYAFAYKGSGQGLIGTQWTDSYNGSTYTETGDIYDVSGAPAVAVPTHHASRRVIGR